LNSLMNYNAKPHYGAKRRVSTLTAIAAALGIKDPYTQGHARRVAIYARRLATRIGLNSAEVENIRLGGLLHDIGKIGLSEQVLKNTRNRLSADMLAQVRQHPQIGVAILKDFNFPKAVIDFIHFHHEKMDGSGYPHGLMSYQIPLGAKIIRVADCFDAITTDRPYQQRKSWIEAFAILHQISGTDLNSELVEAFIADIKENGLALHQGRSISLYSPVFDSLLS
jgi:putative nucleotidyltransferase with HDIG domain